MAIIFYDKQILRYLTVYRGSGGGGLSAADRMYFLHILSLVHTVTTTAFFLLFFFCSIPIAKAMEKIEFFSPFHFFSIFHSLGSKFFHFHVVSSRNNCKIIPSWELAPPPPQENPGSATDEKAFTLMSSQHHRRDVQKRMYPLYMQSAALIPSV